MTERTPWWRAFLGPKKKSGGHKDTGSTPQFGPDFNPFEQRPEKQKDHAAAAASKTPGDQSQPQQESNKHSNLLSDDTFDDSKLDSVFNEQTCRRNMKVSRSGRFKEKKKVRSSLPIQEKEPETVASGKEDIRWQ
ncbi:proline-rich protein 15-like [Stegastes partitus]|uniref:Proline-rich protein 15-like n=1 Tax=Stegastes partitus TaxID=144197 RepID=A0A9Y4KJ85_9TELE|nr:PREDICTED: proline-rich protein 15-like [Stegastes partitus]